MRLVPIAVFLILLAAFVQPVNAQSEEQAAARGLFKEGLKLFKAGQFDQACPKFLASVELAPEALGPRGKLAECYEKTGKTASAWATWRDVEVRSGKAGERKRARIAGRRASQLEKELSYLTIVATDRVPGLQIIRDGAELKEGVLGTAIAVDPGRTVIEARAPGYRSWQQQVEVQVTTKLTVEVPRLEKEPEKKVSPPPAPVRVSDSTATPARRGWKLAGISGVAVGAVSVVVGGVFGLSARSKWDSAGCVDGVCSTQESFDQSRTARSHARLANVFVGLGAVVGVTGGLVWWWSGRSSQDDEPTAWRLVPSADDSSVQVGLLRRF